MARGILGAMRDVIVVGGLTGIGQAVVERLGPERCVVWSRRTGVDATEPGSVAAAFARLDAPPRAWVHAVGDFDERAALASDLDFHRAMLASNYLSALVVGHVLLPALRAARGGRVVLFGAAGVGMDVGVQRSPAYFAAKAALLTWGRAVAAELASAQVTVNMVSPGVIPHATSHAASQPRTLQQVRMGRPGTPAEVAELVAYLLGPHGAYVTGQHIDIDGGLALR